MFVDKNTLYVMVILNCYVSYYFLCYYLVAMRVCAFGVFRNVVYFEFLEACSLAVCVVLCFSMLLGGFVEFELACCLVILLVVV